MANRFQQFVRTDYINLPVDYYQAALAAKESENQQKVNDMRQMLDYAGGVEAVFTPDKQLKEELLAGLDQKIGELAQQNLKTPEVLMKLQNIVSDRKLLNDLGGIQRNTANYQRYLEEKKKYRDAYGNDINFDPHEAAIAEYNALDKSGFQANFLADSSISKYVDVNEGIQKVLKEMKPVKTQRVDQNGNWIYKYGESYLTMDQLLATAAQQLRDPKYTTQLGLLHNYNLRRYGKGDARKGAEGYKEATLQYLDSEIDSYQKLLPTYAKDSKEYNQVLNKLNELKGEQETLSGLSGRPLDNYVASATQKDIALMAASPFVQSESTIDVQHDPFALMRLRYALADNNKAREQQRKYGYDKSLKALEWQREDEVNAVVPQQKTVELGPGPDGTTQTARGFIVSEGGGYDPQKIRTTVTSILNTQKNVYGPKNNSIKLDDLARHKILKYFTGTGDQGKMGTVVYIPKTEEWQIETPEGIFRVTADVATTADMKPLKSIYDQKPGTYEHVVSLDGQNRHEVIVSKKTKDDMSFYVPKDVYTKIDPVQLKKDTGFDIPMEKIRKPGAYIVFDEKDTDIFGGNYGKVSTRVMSIDEYERLRDTEEITPLDGYQLLQVNSQGQVRPLDQYGATMDDINQSHITYSSNKGGAFNNLKSSHKTVKTKGKVSDGTTTGGGASYSGPSDDEEDDE